MDETCYILARSIGLPYRFITPRLITGVCCQHPLKKLHHIFTIRSFCLFDTSSYTTTPLLHLPRNKHLTGPDRRARNRVRSRWRLEVQAVRDTGVCVLIASDEVEVPVRHSRAAAGDGDLRARGVDCCMSATVECGGWGRLRKTHIGRHGRCSCCTQHRPRGVLRTVDWLDGLTGYAGGGAAYR